jgi:flagellin
MKINHNIAALNTFNQLSKNQNSIQTSLERLSSGKRINRAADDAAGMAISQKMDTQIRGLSIASRNAADGISVIQTAEGALNEVHSMLQRMRELSVQASNGTLTNSDRTAIMDEMSQLKTEVNRIGDSTEFNTRKLLNGDIDKRSSSTDASLATLKYVSDSVNPGTYDVSVTQAARQEVLKGGPIPNGTAPTTGTIYINNERIDITATDDYSSTFSKIRDLCDKVGIDLYSSTNPPSSGSSLSMVNQKYGTSNPITVTGDLNTLTSLGLNASSTTSVAGQDIQIDGTALDAAHGFPTGTTVNCKGNQVEISNSGDFDIKLTGATQELYTDSASASAAGKSIGDLKTNSVPYTITGALTAANILGTTGFTTGSHTINLITNVAATTGAAVVVGTAADTISIDCGQANGAFANGITMKILNTPTSTTGPAAVFDSATKTVTVTLAANQGNNTKSNLQSALQSIPTSAGIDFTKFTVTSAGNWSTSTGVAASSLTASVTLSTSSGASSQIDGINIKPQVTAASGLKTYTLANGSTITANFGTTVPATGSFTANAKDVAVQVLTTGPLNLQIGANENQTLEVRVGDIRTAAMGIDDLNVYTSANAEEAISTLDDAIQYVSRFRAKLGAYQNRLEHTTANLDSANENMTAAMSRIEDTDMAQEMSEYTKQNILIQAGTSMLAQANQLPQGVLQLLKG